MDVVILHVGSFHVDFVGAALVPVGNAAKTAVVDGIGEFYAPAHVRVVLVFALVELVVDCPGEFCAVVGTARLRVAFVAQRGEDDGGAVVVGVIVSVPVVFAEEAHVVAVLEVVEQESLARVWGNRHRRGNFGSLFRNGKFYRRDRIGGRRERIRTGNGIRLGNRIDDRGSRRRIGLTRDFLGLSGICRRITAACVEGRATQKHRENSTFRKSHIHLNA